MNTQIKTDATPTSDAGGELKSLYLETLQLVERLHRRLLDVIKDEFDRNGRTDINAVQALLLFNIGDSVLSAGELRSRGFYLGSNVSYNLKKLVARLHQSSEVPRRSPRGQGLPDRRRCRDRRHGRRTLRPSHRFDRQGLDEQEFSKMNRSLQRLDRFERLDRLPAIVLRQRALPISKLARRKCVTGRRCVPFAPVRASR